jgi:hypothetical protein
VKSFRSAWETLLLVANSIPPMRLGSGHRVSNREALASLAHRFRERGRSSIHVPLRSRDAGVTGEHLQLVDRNAIVCES